MEAIHQRLRAAKRVATLAIAAAAAALLLLTVETGQSATSERASASAQARVNISGFKFQPQSLRVAKGTRVVFANSSGVTHTATRGGAFDTGRIKAGQSVAVRFASKGTFRYHCKIHSFMRGTIVVG
jgi:plastocyanin